MNKLNFDARGHLTPYELIKTDWKSFAETFAWNDDRSALIDQLRSFLINVNDLSISTFILWIDGSFVTKKEQPNDIDVVLVLPSITHQKFESELRRLRDQFTGLDVYFVRLIEEIERDHFLYISDCSEWFFQFTMTKPDRFTRRKFPKGFVQLSFNNESAIQCTY